MSPEEGGGVTPLIVPEAAFVGPLAIIGAELKKRMYSYVTYIV